MPDNDIEAAADVARRGHWISLGQASEPLAPIDVDVRVARSSSFSRPVVFDVVGTRQALSERATRLWDALAAGSPSLIA